MNYDEVLEDVSRAQDSMLRIAPSWCSAGELDEFRCLIRLTVESFHYFQREDSHERRDIIYQCNSTFSGIESFQRVTAVYRLAGETANGAPFQAPSSIDALKERFAALYTGFRAEDRCFEERCRLLVDLFRLQIIFAAWNYH